MKAFRFLADSSRATTLGYGHMPALTPDEVFAGIIRGAHSDVLFLTAGLLLHWCINDKQASDIGGRTARALLRREGGAEDRYAGIENEPSFQSRFLDFLRLEIVGESHVAGSNAAVLEQFVEVLDRMTERRVVPGRVYSSSTLRGRHDILLAITAILAATVPLEGDDGLAQRIDELSRDGNLLPGGDSSLRRIVRELENIRSLLEQPVERLDRGIETIEPSVQSSRCIGQLLKIVIETKTQIETERHRRLKSLPVDPEKLERIRLAVEVALLKGPTMVFFFQNVLIERAARNDTAEWCEVAIGKIEKALLVKPEMADPIMSFEEFLVSESRTRAAGNAWHAFINRPRAKVKVDANVEQEAFWKQIAKYVEKVGPRPVLVLSRTAEGRALRHFVYELAKNSTNLRVEMHPRDQQAGSYVATIEGVDVFGADFSPGAAWLFSGEALQRIRYTALDVPAQYVDISFDCDEAAFGSEEAIVGVLKFRFRQQLEWSDAPVYEIRFPDTD